ncbi:MAG: hypothetical protein QM426_04010 [Euryarchaeota archaeon]|nr:hypothetical protein [Euryarchaeota archaeon]
MLIVLLLLSPSAFEVYRDVLYNNLALIAAFGIVSTGFGEILTVLLTLKPRPEASFP